MNEGGWATPSGSSIDLTVNSTTRSTVRIGVSDKVFSTDPSTTIGKTTSPTSPTVEDDSWRDGVDCRSPFCVRALLLSSWRCCDLLPLPTPLPPPPRILDDSAITAGDFQGGSALIPTSSNETVPPPLPSATLADAVRLLLLLIGLLLWLPPRPPPPPSPLLLLTNGPDDEVMTSCNTVSVRQPAYMVACYSLESA